MSESANSAVNPINQGAQSFQVKVMKRAAAPVVHQVKKKKVAAYCRVSRDLDSQTTSLETQMKTFNSMIKEHADWQLAGIYADEGISGTSVVNRVQFQKMIADCEAGKIDYIVTKSISRFARNTMDCLDYIRKLKELGVYIYFDENHFDTGNSTSEMMITILAAVAQEESRSISENMKLGMRMRFKSGQPKWVKTYGFCKCDDGEYRPDPIQAAGVRRIFEMYLAGGSMQEMIDTLARENIPAQNGGPWHIKTLSDVLHNEKYAGDVMMQKCYTVDHLSHKKVKNDQTVVPSYYVRDHHEAIVDRDTFETVQEMIALRDRYHGNPQYPYGGRLVCPYCGEKMIAFRNEGIRRPRVWTCSRDGDNACPPFMVTEKCIDQAVLRAYDAIDTAEVERLIEEQAEDVAIKKAAKVLLDRKLLPTPATVEYPFIRPLIDKITFTEDWSEMVISWKYGAVSHIPMVYEKITERPMLKVDVIDGRFEVDGKGILAGNLVYKKVERNHAVCLAARAQMAGGKKNKAGSKPMD